MSVLSYILVPVLLVTIYSIAVWMRNRKPTSIESGVDEFRREMQALSPEEIRQERRRVTRPSGPPPARRTGNAPRER